MEQKTGFLVHLAMKYLFITPFLRGIYLNMNSCQTKIDRGGWKLSQQSYDSSINTGGRQGCSGYSSGYREEDRSPRIVKAIGKFSKHFSALSKLFKEDGPDLSTIWGADILEVLYIFGDAYGSVFGLSWMEGISVGYRFGVWNEEVDVTSSPFREFCNIVETLEEVRRKVNLQGKEVCSARVTLYLRASLWQVQNQKCYSIW